VRSVRGDRSRAARLRGRLIRFTSVTDDQQFHRAFLWMLSFVRQRIHDSMGPWKGFGKKKPSRPAPAGIELERLVVDTMTSKPNVWGALRQEGLEPGNLPADVRDSLLEDVVVSWSRQIPAQIGGLNPASLEMRVRLAWLDPKALEPKVAVIQSSIDRYRAGGETANLYQAARIANETIGLVATQTATVDMAALVLGESDPAVRESRERLQAESTKCSQVLDEAIPLLREFDLHEGLGPA
jgi:hypothetical protein